MKRKLFGLLFLKEGGEIPYCYLMKLLLSFACFNQHLPNAH